MKLSSLALALLILVSLAQHSFAADRSHLDGHRHDQRLTQTSSDVSPFFEVRLINQQHPFAVSSILIDQPYGPQRLWSGAGFAKQLKVTSLGVKLEVLGALVNRDGITQKLSELLFKKEVGSETGLLASVGVGGVTRFDDQLSTYGLLTETRVMYQLAKGWGVSLEVDYLFISDANIGNSIAIEGVAEVFVRF